jgi:hypothetical protein
MIRRSLEHENRLKRVVGVRKRFLMLTHMDLTGLRIDICLKEKRKKY